MRHKKKELVTVEKDVEVSITCDVCGKEVLRRATGNGDNVSSSVDGKRFVSYYHLTTGHYDWA